MWPFTRSEKLAQEFLGQLQGLRDQLAELKSPQHSQPSDFDKLRMDVDDLYRMFRKLNGRLNAHLGKEADEPATNGTQESPLDVVTRLRGRR